MNGFQILRGVVAVGALLGASVQLSTAALAQTTSADDGPRTEVVSYADLDLSRPAGQHALSLRIKAAADRVCGPGYDRVSFPRSEEYSACMRRAQRSALQSVAASEQSRAGAKLAQNAPHR